MVKRLPIPLLITALGLIVLPPVLLALGLTMTSATEVVVYAIACMALNILVGHTGLVSFGHGAWFGFAAYAAGLLQRNVMHDSFFGPILAGGLPPPRGCCSETGCTIRSSGRCWRACSSPRLSPRRSAF